MKKILFILGLASLLVTGCGDFFDTAPSNKIPTAIAFRTVTDVDNAVNGRGMICRVLRKVEYAIHAICSIIVLIV